MSMLSRLSKMAPSILTFKANAVPTISIEGNIDYNTTHHVQNMLEKIPKNKQTIGILVNSTGGCYAQTHIIIQKISQLAKRNKAEVWTFGQELALNAGFMLLASGNKVFVDESTVVGGLQVGQSKVLRGKLGQYISSVTYFNQPSYLSEMNNDAPFNPHKKEELLAIYQQFSQQLQAQIKAMRKGKINQGVNFSNFYIGRQAVNLGLADQVDRIHLALAKQNLNKSSSLLDKSNLQKWLQKIRKLNISD